LSALGWVDFDPTNDVRVGTDPHRHRWGRDFGDVSPLRGVIVGGGGIVYRFAFRCRQSKIEITKFRNIFGEFLGQANYRSREEAKGGRRKARQDAKQRGGRMCRGSRRSGQPTFGSRTPPTCPWNRRPPNPSGDMNNYVSPWMDDGGTNEIMKEIDLPGAVAVPLAGML